MKKILAIILSMCLLCGTVALADTTISSESNNAGQTTVTYKIDVPEAKYDYILTIPSQVDLTNGSQAMQVKLDTTGVTGTDKKIFVKMEADWEGGNQYFTLTNTDGDVIRYEIKRASDSSNVYANASSIMVWTPGTSSAEGITVNWMASVVEADLENAAGGEYTDTLNFSVTLEAIE